MELFLNLLLTLLLLIPVLCAWEIDLKQNKDEIVKAYQVHAKKTYTTKDSFRKNILLERVDVITAHNAKFKTGEHSYKLELNKFADWTPDELKQVLGYKAPSAPLTSGTGNTFSSLIYSGINLESSVFNSLICPKVITNGRKVDFRSNKCWSKILDQGRCGSCYAFSALQVLNFNECVVCKRNGSRYSSEQNIVDCSKAQGNQGCNGGWMEYVFDYMKQSPGIVSDALYPYKGVEGTCKFDASRSEYKEITGYKKVQECETEMMKLLDRNISLCVAIRVEDDFFMYKDGVYGNAKTCNTKPNQLNHAVVIVGYGTDEASGKNYWLIKNSWDKNWGYQGMMKLELGCCCLGVCFSVGYPTFTCRR